MLSYSKLSVFFWLGFTDKQGRIFYRLWFDNKVEETSFSTFKKSVKSSNKLGYPVICLN